MRALDIADAEGAPWSGGVLESFQSQQVEGLLEVW